jgi:FlaA1/EpsC-like NDP-sugar epimerase
LLYEELLIGDNVSETDNPLIMRAQENMHMWDELNPILNGLQTAIVEYDQKKLRETLVQVVPEFKPQCNILDMVF